VLSTANDTDDFFNAPGGKAYIRRACAEIREDSEASMRAGAFQRSRDEHGVVGERNDNRGDREQGIEMGARDRVLTAPYERQRTLSCECSSGRASLQSVSGRKADDSSYPRAVSKIINDQHSAHRLVSLALLLTGSGAQFTALDPTTL